MDDVITVNGDIAYRCKLNPNYFVSKSGNIYSIYVKGGQGRIDISNPHRVIPSENKDGYERIVLSMNKQKRYVCVHSLVAEQFIGNLIGTNNVTNHIDGNIHNNNLENLEVVSVQENTIHAHANGLCGRDRTTVVYVNGVAYVFSTKAMCSQAFPDLSYHYLSQLERGIIIPSMILFVKETPASTRSRIISYYNGVVYKTFNSMKEADEFFNMSHGFVSSTIINDSVYRNKVNQYHVEFY